MERLPKLHELSREALEEHCAVLQVACDILTDENEQLGKASQELLLIAKQNGDMAENYQRMFNELFEVIKTQYDANFTVEDIPKLPS
ncbi:hypothetical protein B9T24_11645 [Acinetobacter sp. ANC 4654]|uniref:hypothetical protein n=1 Tax=Acinetobacter sp. ANC 4654 TaxID=1977872 RepID=UPI000A32C9B5|nr:hypothetical protein [Acinetobacter sp. ANC 4654]OTG94408.1 hypothetical protein B9T24_11645 [Acinetobacter sp. ANC 4654]